LSAIASCRLRSIWGRPPRLRDAVNTNSTGFLSRTATPLSLFDRLVDAGETLAADVQRVW
jgi:hypothetical protein